MGGSLGFRNLSLFPVRKQQVSIQFFTTRHERKVGLPCPHGEFVHQKSPAATNSSIAHEQKDVNEVDDDRTRTGCNAAVFFEFALFENLGG